MICGKHFSLQGECLIHSCPMAHAIANCFGCFFMACVTDGWGPLLVCNFMPCQQLMQIFVTLHLPIQEG